MSRLRTRLPLLYKVLDLTQAYSYIYKCSSPLPFSVRSEMTAISIPAEVSRVSPLRPEPITRTRTAIAIFEATTFQQRADFAAKRGINVTNGTPSLYSTKHHQRNRQWCLAYPIGTAGFEPATP